VEAGEFLFLNPNILIYLRLFSFMAVVDDAMELLDKISIITIKDPEKLHTQIKWSKHSFDCAVAYLLCEKYITSELELTSRAIELLKARQTKEFTVNMNAFNTKWG